MKKIVYFSVLIIIFLFLSEITLRALGRHPWRAENLNITVEPGGKFFKKDHLLGYTHLPGRFKVTLRDNYVFNVTHLENTLRITHPISTYDNLISKPEIWIFGCSITHGWSINDQETYPYLLQEKLSDYEVVNFGVSGYGTLHALIQLKEALKAKKPQLVIIAYGSFHDERNTFSRGVRKTVAPWNKLGALSQPYARLGPDKKLQYGMAAVDYREFPLMRYSALVNLVEEKYNIIEGRLLQSHQVSKAIIKEISLLCKEHNIKLIVAGITSDWRTVDMLRYCKSEGISPVDISVDLTIPGNNNLPIDGHPSALANKKFAKKLLGAIQDQVPSL
jgi:hypothetical protein